VIKKLSFISIIKEIVEIISKK